MWAHEHEIDSAALQQLRNIASLPWVVGVRVMPDVHLGKGATVGSVIAMSQAVAPAAVGVDIGCGMAAVRTSLRLEDLPDDLHPLRLEIEAAVPVGFAGHQHPIDPTSLGMPRNEFRAEGWGRFWDAFDDLDPRIQDQAKKAHQQMGSLGGGNHFIEVCSDDDGAIWVMLHSGSRGIGNLLAQAHMTTARTLPHNDGIPDRDLAVFLAGTPEMAAYRRDLEWAQDYALRNRAVMMALVQRVGAGDLGLIPGSMGTGSFVVRGLGNVDSYCSASHGAGRRMSRSAAKKRFSEADLAAQTAGVECRKDAGVVDEIPGAYKDLDSVIAAQSDLVEVVTRLTTLLCVKG